MAGWITAFKAIPWSDLIAAAPVVVRGTRSLWHSVRSQKAPPAAGGDPASRLPALEAQVEEMRAELTAASGLIATLAEQNERLVEALAIMQSRTRALLIITAILGAGVMGLVVHAVAR